MHIQGPSSWQRTEVRYTISINLGERRAVLYVQQQKRKKAFGTLGSQVTCVGCPGPVLPVPTERGREGGRRFKDASDIGGRDVSVEGRVKRCHRRAWPKRDALRPCLINPDSILGGAAPPPSFR